MTGHLFTTFTHHRLLVRRPITGSGSLSLTLVPGSTTTPLYFFIYQSHRSLSILTILLVILPISSPSTGLTLGPNKSKNLSYTTHLHLSSPEVSELSLLTVKSKTIGLKYHEDSSGSHPKCTQHLPSVPELNEIPGFILEFIQ